MIPLALALLQAQAVTLAPFADDGQTRLPPAPILLPLVRGAATLPGGTRAWFTKGALFVDRNRNGKPDPAERTALAPNSLQAPDGRPVTIYAGRIAVGAARYAVRVAVSDTKVPDFAGLRDRLALLPLFGGLGTARLGGKPLRIGVRGTDVAHGTIMVDRDGDGRPGSLPMEVYPLARPFNVGGTTYRATGLAGGRLSLGVSPVKVAEVPLPPDLRVGRVAPAVPGRTLAGKTVAFPRSFSGKLVLLDVWATWCGPCKGEIPYMRDAYAKYRKRGFEICSMSIDDPGMGPQVAAFTRANGMTWTQVFQGQGWASPVCRRYNIRGIPFMLLVDGSTGKIVATEDRLRGPALATTLEGALALRGR